MTIDKTAQTTGLFLSSIIQDDDIHGPKEPLERLPERLIIVDEINYALLLCPRRPSSLRFVPTEMDD